MPFLARRPGRVPAAFLVCSVAGLGLTLTERDLNEAKLSLFQGLDAPVAPSAYGGAIFSLRLTDEMRQTQCVSCGHDAYITHMPLI
jgi:hypothetical protein